MFNINVRASYLCLSLSLCFLFAVSLKAEHPDLAGYWNFNDSVLDLSGNDSDGIVTGATTYNSAGKVGKAFEFDGNTSIDCGNSSTLAIADNISIEMWLYPTQWPANGLSVPLSKSTDLSDANYRMYFYDSGHIYFLATAGGVWQTVAPAYVIPSLNTWYHIVWTYNSVTGGKLYVNGVQQGSTSGGGTLATSSANLTIGKLGTYGFDGYMDELKIYNKVLTLEEVQQNEQNALLRGYWNLHDNTIDFSGNENYGIVAGTTTYNSAGKVGKAFEFDGNTSIDCGNNSSLAIADNISIEMWLYPTAWPASGSISIPLDKSTDLSDANYRMYFQEADHKFYFMATAGGVWKGVSPWYEIPSLNTWYHIVWTYNSVTGGKLYVNGAYYSSSPGGGTLATSSANLTIGKLATYGFDGYMDEVRIYNKVLSSSEISAKYQDVGTDGIVLENDTMKLTIDADGKIPELIDKATGQNHKGSGIIDFMRISKNNVAYNSTSCLQKNSRLLVDFGDANITAEITTKTSGKYFVFQIHSIYGDTAGLTALYILNNSPIWTYCDRMSGIRGTDTFSLAIRAMNARSDITKYVFPGVAESEYGLELAKFSLLGDATSNIRSDFQTMLTAEGLPRSSMGGPWALDADINAYSYIWAFDLTTSNVSDYIALAQASGCKIINFYSWWNSNGHYEPNSSLYPNGIDDIKACVDAIHAAGLKASLHCLSGMVSTNDPYLTPVPDPRLLKDAQFTLSSAIGTTDTTIYVNEQPTSALDSTGKVLQVGNEVITYYSYTDTAPYSFNGCVRGAYSTTAQSQAANTSVDHLFMYNNAFSPDPDSTLVREIASNISNVFNYCDFDMIYLDAAECMGSKYGIYKMGAAIFNNIEKDVRVESSVRGHLFWPFYSTFGAGDYPFYGIKSYNDLHVASIIDGSTSKFLQTQLGWWTFLGFSDDYYSQLPDEFEYVLGKSLGCDASMSYEHFSIDSPPYSWPYNGRQAEYLAMAKAYNDLRTSDALSEAAKAQLRTAGDEFHLTLGTNVITQRDNITHKVKSLFNLDNYWTVNNRFSTQSPKLRLRVLHSDLTTSYDNGPNITLTDFQNAGDFALTNASNVTSTLTVNGGICTYTATNNTASPVGAWTKASKTFSPLLDISGGYDTFGVWVYGDNKGEVLNFQLAHEYPARVYSDHRVEINFTGWKYFELFLRERDVDEKYVWPYGTGFGYHGTLVRNQISNLNIYYNNLPVGQQVSCQIKPVKALLTESIGISSPTVNINSTTWITFPGMVYSGQYIEYYSVSDCKLYDANGTFVRNVTPVIGSTPTMYAGNNSMALFGTVMPSGYNARAEVTMIIDGAQVHP